MEQTNSQTFEGILRPPMPIWNTEAVFIHNEGLVAVEYIQLLADEAAGQIYVQSLLRKLTNQQIIRVETEFTFEDVAGEPVGESVCRTCCGFAESNELQDNFPVAFAGVARAKLRITCVVYEDGTQVSCGDEGVAFPAAVFLEPYFGDPNLVKAFFDYTKTNGWFVPAQGEGFWRCSCGNIHRDETEVCPVCGGEKAVLMGLMNSPDPRGLLTQVALQAQQEQMLWEQQQYTQQMLANKKAAEEKAARKAQQERERQEWEKKEATKKRVISGIIALSVLCVCLILVLIFPSLRYKRAMNLLDRGQYMQASEIFRDLEDYKDSRVMAKESIYRYAQWQLDNGYFDEASDLFVSLGNYEDSPKMAQEALYKKARYQETAEDWYGAIETYDLVGNYKDAVNRGKDIRLQEAEKLTTQGEYEQAYALYRQVGDYKDCKESCMAMIDCWIDLAFVDNNYGISVMQSLTGTVYLEEDEYALFYASIRKRLSTRTDHTYWTNTEKNQTLMLMLLEELPYTYEDVEELTKLFTAFSNGYYTAVYEENTDLIWQCWDYGFVKDYVQDDSVFAQFLIGYWTGSGYYFKAYEDEDDGSVWTSFSLPWVAKPSGTKYYGFDNMVYYWRGDSRDHLADVFRFEIVSRNTIRVYCYKNNTTYTMYR